MDTRRSVSLTRITAPGGKWAIVAGIAHNEYLVPSTVGRFDRRLGVSSPWFALPPAQPP